MAHGIVSLNWLFICPAHLSDAAAACVDWVVVLRRIRHKIGHLGDGSHGRFPNWLGMDKKTKPITIKAGIHQ